MSPQTYAIIFASLCCTVAGQLLFRGAALAANTFGSWLNLRSAVLFCTAIAMYTAMTFLWTHALREVSLARAFPFMAIAYVILPVAEHFLFAQALHWNALAGGAVIMAGICLTQLQ